MYETGALILRVLFVENEKPTQDPLFRHFDLVFLQLENIGHNPENHMLPLFYLKVDYFLLYVNDTAMYLQVQQQTLDFVEFSPIEKFYEGEVFIQLILRFCNRKTQ